MSEGAERIARLEERVDSIITRNETQDARIEALNKEIVDGLKSQEQYLRQMVSELQSQQQEMHIAYERMGAFTKGVLWIGGLGAAAATFFLKYGDKIKDFFGS